ncbi:MAG: mRNA-degrading endonuclease, partial [Bacteroidetes bacterium]|nr:mRNA-degrading endonuclease [Bacteroidota bacterium]
NKVAGVVLSDQVKSLDWKIRDAEICDKAPEAVVLEIFKKLETLLSFDGQRT